MPAPLTAAAAIAAFNSNSLPAGTTIFDSAFHVANTADALQAIVTANPALITSILFNNPDRPAVPVTVAQLAADAGLGPLINSPASFTQRVTAAAASTTILAAGFTSISVVDSAANIQANIAGIQTLYSQGWLGPIFYTDSGTPTISLPAASVAANIAALSRIGGINLVLTDPGTPTLTLPNWATFLGAFTNVVALISTPFNLAFAGTIRSTVIANIEDQATRVTNFTIRGQATDPIAPLGVIYSGYLPSGLNVFDNPLYPAVFLDSLQIAAVAGKLNSVTGYYSGPNLISLTPAMVDANALALSKFSPNFQYSQIITAAQAASPPALDARFFNYTVQDTTANILANITAVNALFRSSRAAYLITAESEPDFVMTAAQFAQAALPLATYGDEFLAVTLTGAGTPTVTLAADVLAMAAVRANVLRFVTGPYHLAVTGAIRAQLAANIVNENTVVKTSLTNVAVYDTASAIAANIGALNTLVSLGAISAITLNTSLGTVQSLNLTTNQQATYAAVLAKISGAYVAGTATAVPSSMTAASFVANIATIESGVLAGTQGAITLTDPGTPTISVSAAVFLANLDAFALITTAPVIALTDGGTPALALSASQASQNVLTALSRISTGFTLSISGPISTPVASTVLFAGLVGKLSAPLNVLDGAGSFDFRQPGQLTALQSLYAAGKLATITLADSPFLPTNINLTAAQATASAGALSTIVSPHAFGLVVSAAQATTTTIPQGIFQYLQISDTSANIIANLPALETLAPSGKLTAFSPTDGSAIIPLSVSQVSANYDVLRYLFAGGVTLTDGGTPTIEIQTWQFANDASALNRITSPFKLQIDGPVRVGTAITLANAGYASKIVSGSLLVRDTGSAIISALTQLSALYTAGDLVGIEIRGNLPILSLTSGQLTSLNAIAPAITTPYLVSQIISVANLPSPTLAAGFNFFTITDSVANILANLPALQTLALGGKLNATVFTDAVPRIVTTAAAISTYGDFWNQGGTFGYPIVLTDGGTPVITVQSGQLGYNLRNNVLDTIAGPYSLQITGTVSASLAGSIVEENNSVLRSLTGNLTIADNTANIAQYYDQLEYLARLGRIVSITVRDTGGTINVTPSQAAADSAITPLIQGSYTLAQTAPCFAEGTHIRTQRGQIKVEALEVGDIAITATGSRPITWIGHRRVDCARHPRPWDVNPVRVARHAFAPSRPMRDLWLSPDHAVFHNGVLIPIRYLINGATIIQEARDTITYFHVELDSHDILMAEALPTESFLDTGNRGAFANGDGAMMLHPDFALKIWEASACAPLVLDGALVAAARNHLFERAKELGHATTEDPDLHLLADGVVIRPDWIGAKIVFLLPNRFTALRLVSRSHVPADISPAALDRRQLGVAVIALVVDGRPVVASPGDGWYAAEDGLQWTDGNAAIPVQGGAVLELRVAGIGRYWDNTSIYRLPLAQRG